MAISRSRQFGLSTFLFLSGIVVLIGGQTLWADAPATAPSTQASTDAIDQLLQTHQYGAALKSTNKLLALRDPTSQGFDPYQLWMLKGEAYIGTKSLEPAISAFKSAAKATSDPHELAVANCTVLLLQNSNPSTYIPKTAPAGGVKPAPVPLADRDQRTAAFTALLNDQLTALRPKIDAAAKSPNLQPVYPLLQQLADMNDLDQIANGNDDKTVKIAAGLLDHAHNMIVAALKGMWGRLDEIDKNANNTTINTQINPVPVGAIGLNNSTTIQKAGLSDDNKAELKDMIDTCDKIHQAAAVFMGFAATGKDKEWAAVISDAARIIGRANDMLNFTYASTYSSGNNYNNYNTGSSGQIPAVVPGYNPVLSIIPGQTVTQVPSLMPVQGINPTQTPTTPTPPNGRSQPPPNAR
jgi:hypothetical protein